MGVEFRILGPVEALRDGQPIPLGGGRQRAVLAVLLLHAGEVVSAGRLIDAVWDNEPPAKARNVLQSYISQLRKSLGAEVIRTQGGGYRLAVPPDEFDLERFQRLTQVPAHPEAAAESLSKALSLWRGDALADVADSTFLRAAAARLDELRLSASEQQIETELALGRSSELVGQVEALVREHPLRERLRGLQMVALYRAGRQAEALEAFRVARATLVHDLGIEPAPALRELERAILRHDPSLDPRPAGQARRADPPARSIIVAPRTDAAIPALCSIAEPLARDPRRELIVVRLLEEDGDAGLATARLAVLRDELRGRGQETRVAAYTSLAPGEDVVVLAAEQDADLVLVDAAPNMFDAGAPDPSLSAILRDAPCDVAVLVTGGLQSGSAGPVVVPFSGAEHDWTAVELAAWTARSLGTGLRLVGTSADRLRRRRDAGRLLGRVSLVVQAALGIVAEPVLVRPGAGGVLAAATDASLLAVGLSARWEAEGLGAARLAVASSAQVPTLVVRRGLRPGGLAPKEGLSRFTWSLAPASD